MPTNAQKAWSTLLEDGGITFENGVSSTITSDQIRSKAGARPRLVCNLDSRKKLPPVLKEQNLFILAVENGAYQLVKGDGYHDLEPISGPPETHTATLPFELTTASGDSEDRYLQYAYNTGLLSRFTGIDRLIQGSSNRQRSNRFTFYVGDSGPITVDGVQIQTDGVFEGKSSIALVEAKAGSRESFWIRQVYYPFRQRRQETSKDIKSLFFLYDGESKTYNFWEYVFSDPKDYASISLERSQSYKIKREKADISDIAVEKEEERSEWRIPQADKVWKIEKLPFLVDQGIDNYKGVAKYFEFDKRQSNYYRDAAEILGLVRGEEGKYVLTEKGQEFIEMRPDQRSDYLLKNMLRLPIMNEVFQEMVRRFQSEDPYVTREEIAEIIENNSDLSGKTLKRRAGTIRSWFEWISQNAGVVSVDKEGLRLYL